MKNKIKDSEKEKMSKLGDTPFSSFALSEKSKQKEIKDSGQEEEKNSSMIDIEPFFSQTSSEKSKEGIVK